MSSRLLLVFMGVLAAAAPPTARADQPREAKQGEAPEPRTAGDDGAPESEKSKDPPAPERTPAIRAHEVSPDRPRTDEGPSPSAALPAPPSIPASHVRAPPTPPPTRRVTIDDTRAGLRSTPPPSARLLGQGR
jgi:hypothetical protein